VSEWAARSFTTLGHVPRLLLPAFGTANVSLNPTLIWSKVPQAASYGLMIVRMQGQNGSITYDTVITIASGINDTAHQVGPLQPGGNYQWYVGSVIPSETSWSLNGFFSTIPPAPGAPILKIPAPDTQGVLSAFCLFSWNPDVSSGLAQTYHVQVSADTAFASAVLDTTVTVPGFMLIARLSPLTRYYWRVQGSNATGPGAWSQRSTFVTAPGIPAAPAIISPVNNSKAEPLSPVLRWHSSLFAVKYVVKLQSFIDTGLVTVVQDTLTDTSLAVGPLLANHSYFWSVQSLNAQGGNLSFAGFSTLPPLPAKPTTLFPAPGAVDVAASPKLAWTDEAQAYDYHVVISRAADFSAPVLDTTFENLDTTFAAKGLVNDVTYYWRVRGENTAGAGAWSEASFTTIVRLPDTVTLVFPLASDTLRSDSVKSVWRASGPKVDRYWIAVSQDSTFASAFADTAVTDTSRIERFGSADGAYWWKVKAHNAAGWGGFGRAQRFTVAKVVAVLPPKDFSLKVSGLAGGTDLRYALPKAARVRIRVFDFKGGLRAFPVDAEQAPGRYALRLPGLPGGFYFLSFQAGPFHREIPFVAP
jgi:hypothetical protein